MESWRCPKCGREFKRVDQQHFCGKPRNVDEYIAGQEERVQLKLQELRGILRAALPEAEERISWSMPTYWKGQNLIHFAAAKKHIGLYPGKGTIRLAYDQPLPADLISRIAQWCSEEYAK